MIEKKDEIFKNFEKLKIYEPVILAMKDLGFKKATVVQKRAIPLVKEDLNLIIAAPTGSGKTLIYAERIIQTIVPKTLNQAIVLVPTKELAFQVKNMIDELSKYRPIEQTIIVGGENKDKILKELKTKTQVVIGTPDTISNIIDEDNTLFENLHILIFDEMDALLKKEFLPKIENIISNIPRKRQTLMFSATITKEVSKFAQKYMKKAQRVIINEKEMKKNITHYTYEIETNKKLSLLSYLLEKEISGLNLIFINRKEVGEFIKKNLKHLKLKIEFLHKDLTPNKRKKIINDFIDEKIDVLITTDIVARGLDVDGISHVYNYNIPKEITTYTHRIGRCARGEMKKGTIIDFVTKKDIEKYLSILNEKKIKPIIKQSPENLKEIQIKHNIKKREFNKKNDKKKRD